MILLGMPIAYALGVSSLITVVVLGLPFELVVQQISDGMDNFALLAIPFFILMGQIMAQGGMANRLINFSNILVGWFPGGLAMVNILASMFFGGISGSSVADTSCIGGVLIPMMNKKGYDRDFSVNVTITSSTQGIIIPPSHNAIIYALAAGGAVSIAKLFLAGIIPGILVGISLMVVSLIIAIKRKYPREKRVSLKDILVITKNALLGLVAAVIIVGGVLSGVFTATESSAIAVVYSFIITFFVYHKLTDPTPWKKRLKSVFNSILVVFALIVLAKVILNRLDPAALPESHSLYSVVAAVKEVITVISPYLIPFIVLSIIGNIFLHRKTFFKDFPKILFDSVKTISLVMILIGTSTIFKWLMAYLQIPGAVTGFFFEVTKNPVILMILINVLLLLLGTIMDMAPLILITTPILLPVVVQLGISPIHFGIIMMLNLGIGLCTPPVGSTLFVGCAIGKISIEEVTRKIWPFYVAMIVVLMIVTYVPGVAMWLPDLLK